MKLALLLAISAIEFGAGGRIASGSAPDAAPRYRLVQVVETPILVEKVNAAARDGYRLAGVAPAMGGTTVAVLEKTTRPGDPYSYMLLGGKGDAALEQALNDAGGKGFRLVSRDVAMDWRPPAQEQWKLRTVIAWMEKSPGPLAKYEYAVIAFGVKMALKSGLNPKLWADLNPLDYVKSEINSAESRGFRLVRIVSGVALIMEKAVGPEGEGPAPPKWSSPPYRSLTRLEGPKLQRKLQQQAVGGYCLVDMDLGAPPVWPSLLLDKTGTRLAGDASEVCSYEVIQKPDLTEDDLNQAGAHGFRLVPQSLNFYALYQSDFRTTAKANAIFEKIPTRTHVYHYRDISAPQLSELPGKLEQAAADGYRAIKVDTSRDGAVRVIMQMSEELPDK